MIQVLTNSATTDTGTGDASQIHQQKGVVAIIPKYWRMPAISVKKARRKQQVSKRSLLQCDNRCDLAIAD